MWDWFVTFFTPRPSVNTTHRVGSSTRGSTGVILVLVWFVVCLGGCGEENRYRVLSFFFDGVPKPGEVEQLKQELAQKEAQAEKEASDTPAFFLHRPYENRKCRACHSVEGSFEPKVSDPLLCRRCHESYYKTASDDWVHGPVIFNQCALCHLPHKSKHAKLLHQAQPQLCLQCHDGAFFKEDPFHSQLENLRCSNCHEPHAAGNRLLLADSQTYQRRKTHPDKLFKHPEWKREDCARCHLIEQSYKLMDEVDKACVICHQKQTVPTDGRKLHSPVQKGQCTQCHTPHRSPREHLIKPEAEKLCLGCHEEKSWASERHPKVTRVDCLICHQGHHMDRPHMLKPNLIETIAAEPSPKPNFNPQPPVPPVPPVPPAQPKPPTDEQKAESALTVPPEGAVK